MGGKRSIVIFVTFYLISFIEAAKSEPRKVLEIQDGDPCVPGQTYKMDCNICHCSVSGLVCSKMACLRKSELRSSGEVCAPGKFYTQGCSRCFCNNEAKLLCGSNDCRTVGKFPTSHEAIHAYSQYSPSEQHKLPVLTRQTSQCSPGVLYRVDCNSCLCLANGNLACGNRLCPSHDDVHRATASGMSGKPCDGKENEMECVHCQCIEGNKMCQAIPKCVPSTKYEPILETSANQCTPGMIYKKSCNRCICSEHRSLRCTMKTCLTKPKNRYLHEMAKVRKHYVDYTLRKATARMKS